jgi:hypothetical protein
MTYEVIFAGQGAGYQFGEKIIVPDENCQTIDDVSWWINRKCKLTYTDLHLIGGNMNEMSFVTRMDHRNFGKVLTIKRRI